MGIEKEQFDINSEVSKFIQDIKYDRVTGTYNTTMITVELFKNIVQHTDWKTAKDLLCTIRTQGKIISSSLPLHSSVGNMVRRIMKIIREEYGSLQTNKHDESEASLHRIVSGEGSIDDYSIVMPELRPAIIDHINEFEIELETCVDNIAVQASEHIHSNEIIMTLGKSKTVEAFLARAAETRKFEVIVASCSPSNHGHDFALRLAKKKIKVTVIPDSAIFGLMSRVNKVIIGTQMVLANGGLRAVCGTNCLAMAAQHYSVPVMVLAPLYQLSPEYLCSYDQASFNKFSSPEGVLSYSDGDIISSIHVYNPVFDYVQPELVTLFVSNIGGHSPSYIYRLLTELYHQDDHHL